MKTLMDDDVKDLTSYNETPNDVNAYDWLYLERWNMGSEEIARKEAGCGGNVAV